MPKLNPLNLNNKTALNDEGLKLNNFMNRRNLIEVIVLESKRN